MKTRLVSLKIDAYEKSIQNVLKRIWVKQYVDIVDYIESSNPTILCLQNVEKRQLEYIMLYCDNYKALYYSLSKNGKRGNAIIYCPYFIDLIENNDEHSGFQWAIFARKKDDAKKFRVVNIDFENTSEDEIKNNFNKIYNLLKNDEAAFVCGDFNAEIHDVRLNRLISACQDVRKIKLLPEKMSEDMGVYTNHIIEKGVAKIETYSMPKIFMTANNAGRCNFRYAMRVSSYI